MTALGRFDAQQCSRHFRTWPHFGTRPDLTLEIVFFCFPVMMAPMSTAAGSCRCSFPACCCCARRADRAAPPPYPMHRVAPAVPARRRSRPHADGHVLERRMVPGPQTPRRVPGAGVARRGGRTRHRTPRPGRARPGGSLRRRRRAAHHGPSSRGSASMSARSSPARRPANPAASRPSCAAGCRCWRVVGNPGNRRPPALQPRRGFAWAAYQPAPGEVVLVYGVHLKSNLADEPGGDATNTAMREESDAPAPRPRTRDWRPAVRATGPGAAGARRRGHEHLAGRSAFRVGADPARVGRRRGRRFPLGLGRRAAGSERFTLPRGGAFPGGVFRPCFLPRRG